MSTTEQDVRDAVAAGENMTSSDVWATRVANFKKFAESFHERGTKIEDRFADDRENALDQMERVNLFFSNVSIIKESLFNSLPKPDVKRLHTGDWDNEPARVAATIVERGLTYEISKAPNFEESIKSAIHDWCVPGMGTVWVEFIDAENGQPEHLAISPVYWKDLLWEPARHWHECMWVGRRVYFTTEEAKRKFGDLPIFAESANPKGSGTGGNSGTNATIQSAIVSGKVCVIQMWDKAERKVYWLTECGTKQLGPTIDDPLKLSGFYPCPRPLIANKTTRAFLPIPDYKVAQDQYMKLDILYNRINLIISAIRVAGAYDSSNPQLGNILGGAENKLIPVDNWALFGERGGIKGAIDFFPIEQVAQVLNHLTGAYSMIKSELFEVTGMSDIVRGASNQYETASAQQIKAQFASVRMNGNQRDTSAFVVDLLKIMAEMQINLYTEQRLSEVCGQLPMDDQPFVPAALELLRAGFTHQASIGIEADSLTQSDWSLQQSQRITYVQALSGFLQSAIPAAQQTPELAPLLVTIIKFASVGFKGSSEIEGVLDTALANLQKAGQNPAPKPPSPEQTKMEADKQAHMLKMQELQAKVQQMQQVHEMKVQQMMADISADRAEHQMQMQQMQEKHILQMQQLIEKARVQRDVSTIVPGREG